jgi:hypothetical protein
MLVLYPCRGLVRTRVQAPGRWFPHWSAPVFGSTPAALARAEDWRTDWIEVARRPRPSIRRDRRRRGAGVELRRCTPDVIDSATPRGPRDEQRQRWWRRPSGHCNPAHTQINDDSRAHEERLLGTIRGCTDPLRDHGGGSWTVCVGLDAILVGPAACPKSARPPVNIRSAV